MGIELKPDSAHLPHTNGSSGTLPERSPPTGIAVLIVGGGVAGLLAGLECWRQGHEVRILEKSPSRVLSGKLFIMPVNCCPERVDLPSS
jgi:heterodisulfide reductase subunit A-like polyferredoxin